MAATNKPPIAQFGRGGYGDYSEDSESYLIPLHDKPQKRKKGQVGKGGFYDYESDTDDRYLVPIKKKKKAKKPAKKQKKLKKGGKAKKRVSKH
jgi:hypothetical protein